MATALGVTVEEILERPRPRKIIAAGGRMGQLFEAARKLPRSQQSEIIAVLEPFVERYGKESAAS